MDWKDCMGFELNNIATKMNKRTKNEQYAVEYLKNIELLRHCAVWQPFTKSIKCGIISVLTEKSVFCSILSTVGE